jgi:hypothetical protein
MMHVIKKDGDATNPYTLSWARHHQAKEAAECLTPHFGKVRCPNCFNEDLIPNIQVNRDTVLFFILSTHANLD